METLSNFIVRAGRAVIHFGPRSVDALRDWVKDYDRVFIVTGRKSAKISGALSDVLSIVKEYNIRYEVFDKVVPNPTASIVNEAALRAWRFGANAMIAIGGGSPIDTAKLAGVIVECGGRAEEYIRGDRIPCNSLPLAVINLTHGTGTEADRYAVATVEETHEKVGVASEYMYPKLSIDDPTYLRTLPKTQTVYTSLDAFYHAFESATGNASSPYVVTLAEEAIKLIVRWLPKALNNPEDIESRYWLLYASMIAGIAIDHGRTHLIHAVEHALSGLKPELPHGAGLAIIGPSIIRLTYEVRPEVSYRLLRYLDEGLEPQPKFANKAANAVRRFQEEVGFKERLRDYGFNEEYLDSIIKIVFTAMKYNVDLAPFKATESTIREIFITSL